VPLQDWIHHWEVGAGARVLKVTAAILAFAAAATLYDVVAYESFSSEEAMETAQVARNLAHGRGYTTQSIRPLSIYLLERGQAGGATWRERWADVSNAPGYPWLLAGLMKALPFEFTATEYWYYQPERWIAVFNQGIFLVAVMILFRVARRLFDARVAWLSAVLMAGTNLYWRFSVSGLSTMWLAAVFLAVVWCLAALEERERTGAGSWAGSMGLALLAGGLAGVGGLSRYAFGWMILPVLLFVAGVGRRAPGRLCVGAAAAYLVVVSPWLARNYELSGNCFGAAGYAIVQETPPFGGDTLERSFNPEGGLRRVSVRDVVDKFLANGREIGGSQLPRLGGNWVVSFFMVGLLLPFRNAAAGRMRLFLAGSMALLFVAQALGQTHLSQDSPEINSENLLALAAPLAFVYGVALFYVLVDQLNTVPVVAQSTIVGIFTIIMCLPFIGALTLGNRPKVNSPYSPLHIQRVARLMREDELLMSDIPGAVAWYGNRECAWLSLDYDREFLKLNGLRRVRALFLTQRTTDQPFLSGMMLDPPSWGHFVEQIQARGEVPTDFPLTNAPTGFFPEQLLLSDQARWRMAP
jgi:hypothetical protein